MQLCEVTAIVLILILSNVVKGDEGFYNIAHMTNTKRAVDWALERGANAVEVDLAFTSTGELDVFYHGEACDCTCICPISSLCENYADNVCSLLLEGVSTGSPCNAAESVDDMLIHLASKTDLALVIIDSKIETVDMSTSSMQAAGRNIIRKLNTHLFDENYLGKVIIGSPRLDTLPYLEAAVGEVNASMYKHRIYYTVDLEQNNIVGTLHELHTMQTSNIVYGTGISTCAPNSLIDDSTLQIAAANKAEGVTGMSYMWTLDRTSSMKHYLPYVEGVMTNEVGGLNNVLQQAGIKLATPSSTISPATSSVVVTSADIYVCECDYSPGGCSISLAAPKDRACKCKYEGFWTCSGELVRCLNTNTNYCSYPDNSFQSCLLGGGNCGGYECDCSYSWGGCSISQAPPPNTACRCTYEGFWTCSGYVTACSDFDAYYCRYPDKSIHTCSLGGGNCDGY